MPATDDRSTEELLEAAMRLAPECRSAKEVFERANSELGINRTWPAWRGIMNRNPKARDAIYRLLDERPKSRHERPQVSEDEDEGGFDVEKYFELSVAASREWSKRWQPNDRMVVSIDTDRPIGVAFTSDWHVGGPGTEHLQIRTDNQLIAAHPQLWAYLGGDWANNYVLPALHHAGMSDIFAVGDQQYEIVRYLAEILLQADSLLAIGDGNHTDWTLRMVNIDPRAYLWRDVSHLYTAHGSVMELRVGEQTYRVFRRHRHRFSSVFNPGHSVVAEYFRGPYEFDVGVIEHQHQPFAGTFDGKEREDGSTRRIAIRTGTYKTKDAFAAERGFHFGSSDMPVVIFYPNEFRMQAVVGLEHAAELLDGYV